MQFGLLYEMETPRPWNKLSEYNVYHEALAQIERADQVGFDYVWEVEHHFLEEYSHSPAPKCSTVRSRSAPRTSALPTGYASCRTGLTIPSRSRNKPRCWIF